MKKQVAGLWLVLSCGVLVAGGCASNQTVKKDEALVPVAQAASPAAKKEEAVQGKTVAQAPVKEAEQSSQQQFKNALDKIYFDFDSANLTDADRATLVKNADALRKMAGAKVRIEGNCDERGSDEYNLALGEKRAEAARKYLVAMGIDPSRLSTISYGKEKPADPGHNETAWAKNRRDEFVVQ